LPICIHYLSRATLHFSFNDTTTPETYTLSLHDALPISSIRRAREQVVAVPGKELRGGREIHVALMEGVYQREGIVLVDREQLLRSEEHTSELQSLRHLVCRLLLEKKKKK